MGSCAGTALVIFDDVLVPVENLMGIGNKGNEGQGFALVMYNFNHERWFIVAQFLAACRYCIADCFKWASQRMAFGKPLIEQPVLRQKLARMAGTLVADESVQMFGGRGITRTGMGSNIEKFQKTYKYASILGGSEEVLADLAVRQQMVGAAIKAKL